MTLFRWALAITGAVIATILALALILLTAILIPSWLDASQRVRAAEAEGLIDARAWQEALPRHVGEAFIAGEFPVTSRSPCDCGLLDALASRPGYRWLAYRICECREGHTLRGMLAERFTAKILESKYNRDQLVDDFARLMYLGRGAVGVEAAAQAWFGKALGEVGPGEAAFLAALSKGNSWVSDPAQGASYAERAVQRRNFVLARMRQLRFIDDGEFEAERASPLRVITPPANTAQ